MGKALSTASGDGAGAGSGRNTVPIPLNPSQTRGQLSYEEWHLLRPSIAGMVD